MIKVLDNLINKLTPLTKVCMAGMGVAAIFLLDSCGDARAADQDSAVSAFKYREIYLPEGIGKNADSLGLNTLEEDWGIWGHNLHKTLPDKPSQSIYAKQNGSTMKKQYCFSSNHLFSYIEDFIDSKFDEDERIRFAILPNDNDIVCLCERCVTAGNTKNNASPAVNKLVKRLSERFPGHIFYTSDYRTTKGLPTDSMPSNTGVLVSAMPYPLSISSSPEEGRFLQRLQAWGNTTKRILVWDYINNFDDYFTPYPALGVMERRLKNYKDNKVTAIFLNGSGPDASALCKLRTHVLALMTANPEVDWREALREEAVTIYPVAGETIAEFMLAQEDYVAGNNATLPLYTGVQEALKTYLPEDKFVAFHDKLINLRDETQGKEREEIDLLLGQLALTRLEINRINCTLDNSIDLLGSLERLNASGTLAYSESGWTLDNYARDYRFLLNHARDNMNKNKLKGERLVALTPLDPDYSDLSIVTDGVLGIPSNYHNGNLITSPESFTQIAVPNKPGMKKLVVWMSYNPAYRVKLPEMVTLSSTGSKKQSVQPTYPEDLSGHSRIEFDVPSNSNGSLVLTFYKEPETHSMAIEEIEGF